MNKTMFRLIELNALLWLAAFGSAIASDAELRFKVFAGIGLAVGGILQHRAYYKLYKDKT